MLRSPPIRILASSLCLLAAAITCLASGISLILCVEADGCVKIEIAAAGIVPGSVECGGCYSHEHTDGGSDDRAADSRVGSCPCSDTVLATTTASVKPAPAAAKLVIPASAAVTVPLVAPAPPGFRFSIIRREAVVLRAPLRAQRSVVLTI